MTDLTHIEKVVEGSVEGICCPYQDNEGFIYLVSKTGGEIYKVVEGQIEFWGITGGKPTGFLLDRSGTAYISNYETHSITCPSENRSEQTPIVTDYEGKELLGPNCMALHEDSNYLYFTDSGTLGKSSLSNPIGSLFAADLSAQVLKPVLLYCLAHPSGLALENGGLNL
jgi:aspartate beta-hydroxylase